MVLIRMIVLKGLVENVRVFAKHVEGTKNVFADSLSRNKIAHFKSLYVRNDRQIQKLPTPVPHEIWPLERIWIQ